MSITVDLESCSAVSLSDQRFDPDPDGKVSFAAEGVVTVTGELLGRLEGSSLEPVAVDLTVEDATTVHVDLDEETPLRFETVDVGVERPGSDDLPSPSGVTDLSEATPVGSSGTDDADVPPDAPGAVAFTVECSIGDVPSETLESLAAGSASLSSVTFAADDVVYELGVFGYAVVIRRNGVLEVRREGSATDRFR